MKFYISIPILFSTLVSVAVDHSQSAFSKIYSIYRHTNIIIALVNKAFGYVVLRFFEFEFCDKNSYNYQRTPHTMNMILDLLELSEFFKKAKIVPSVGKVMATFFWNSQGEIYIDYLKKGKTVTGLY